MSQVVFEYLLTEVLGASLFSWFFYWLVLNVFRGSKNFICVLLEKELPKQEFAATLTAGINAGIWGIKFGGPDKYTLAPTIANIAFWIIIGLTHGFLIRAREKENRDTTVVDIEPESLSLEEEYRQELLAKRREQDGL